MLGIFKTSKKGKEPNHNEAVLVGKTEEQDWQKQQLIVHKVTKEGVDRATETDISNVYTTRNYIVDFIDEKDLGENLGGDIKL